MTYDVVKATPQRMRAIRLRYPIWEEHFQFRLEEVSEFPQTGFLRMEFVVP
jgi:hypothetical protein